MPRAWRYLAAAATVPLAVVGFAHPADDLRPGQRVLLHAHNCYPDNGQWADRLDRALATNLRPIAIEQDVVWAVDEAGRGRSVVSHGTPLSGNEPTLDAHFFQRLRPLVERALVENRRQDWPVVVLHLDFKTNEPAHHRAVWDLLGPYESWLTTAMRLPGGERPSPLRFGPVLVLTEQGEGQEAAFHDQVPAGARLRVFGTVPVPTLTTEESSEARALALAAASPGRLIPSGATNYRRWANLPWTAVERGGQKQAGEWTAGDTARLAAIVQRAHEMGLWIRFYTLNGHPLEASQGWSDSYNFGSLPAVRERWRGAIRAGVDFIATDQYEAFAALLKDRF